ncbi:MAG: 2,5-diamino-6-(ribosylamino)-4(3H)-pyrimidinone 5'-phosphate reductase [Sclerophora amabilis]|nr:MAG: 2,5-diamino-6-(ribosylamino)-4(3H)-pyrimidinone 5'-phosphate reductase [Sclerophora amabilis]
MPSTSTSASAPPTDPLRSPPTSSSPLLQFPPHLLPPLLPYLPPPPPPSPPSPTSTPTSTSPSPPLPHLTLTYASSLDAALSLSPDAPPTPLSGPLSKAMTHHLRSAHDAILVGVGTAISDDPGLNCRLWLAPGDQAGGGVRGGDGVRRGGGGDTGDGGGGGSGGGDLVRQPRPVVLDPRGRWGVSEQSRVVRLAREGRGLGPWVLVATTSEEEERYAGEKRRVLEGVGGRVVPVPASISTAPTTTPASTVPSSTAAAATAERAGGGTDTAAEEGGNDKGEVRMSWTDILRTLGGLGIKSLMVEGGAGVINGILAEAAQEPELVKSVIVTIAPVYLGRGAVTVGPERRRGRRREREEKEEEEQKEEGKGVMRLRDVVWVPMGEDVVLCGRLKASSSSPSSS